MFDENGQNQNGTKNQQAGRDINTTTYNYADADSFDLVETEIIIDDLHSISKNISTKQKITFEKMKIEEKNKINNMESYFNSIIKKDIVYFSEIMKVLRENDNDFQERFKYIIETIKGAILAIDSKEELTPEKINEIFKTFYKQDWDYTKKIRAKRLIHFMYFTCFLGKKKLK